MSQRGCRPAAAWKNLSGIEFILRHYGRYFDTMRPVSLDKFSKIQGISLQVSRILYKHIQPLIPHLVGRQTIPVQGIYLRTCKCTGIMLVILHPRRRTPGRGPQCQLGIILLSILDKWNQRLQVVGNGKIVHHKIAVRFIVRVPVAGKVVSPDRHSAQGKVRSIVGEKQLLHDILALRRIQAA